MSAATAARFRRVIPGFGLSLGFTVTYLSLIVLIPLSALFFKSASLGAHEFWRIITSDWAMSAARFTIGASFLAATINVVMGLLVAWVLARYEFPGRRLVDAIIDLPFALPTAVAGIALTTLYSDTGWVGRALAAVGFRYPWPEWRGFAHGWPVAIHWYSQIALAPLGVVVALTFVGLPFVVRTVQPVLEDMSRDVEEAAASLGARRWQTFLMVLLPQMFPALLTGFALAFARGLGEYGSVVFISGRVPQTETAPELIVNLIETSETMAPATAVAVLLLVVSFALLLVINLLQRRAMRWTEA
jgi:sulfate transport system permease protein